MRTLLSLAPLAALFLCTASVEAKQDRRLSFLLAMPSTKRPAKKTRVSNDKSSLAAGSAGASSGGSPANKTNGDELVQISRRLHDMLKGVISLCVHSCVHRPDHEIKVPGLHCVARPGSTCM